MHYAFNESVDEGIIECLFTAFFTVTTGYFGTYPFLSEITI